jgi:hypothetical protein
LELQKQFLKEGIQVLLEVFYLCPEFIVDLVAVVIVIAQAFLDGQVGKMEDYVVGCLMIPLKKINLGFQVH